MSPKQSDNSSGSTDRAPVTMAEEILVETRGNNILVDMPGTSYRVRYRKPNSGRLVVAYQLPKADDPLAGITIAHFMKLASARIGLDHLAATRRPISPI
jgi:hypothetical protein